VVLDSVVTRARVKLARYLIVVPRPLFAAALVGCCRYLIVVPRPMPAAPRMYLIVVQAVARSAARCALHVHGHGAKTDACGRSFAVLSTPVSTAGLRLRHKILAWCPSRCPRRHAGTLWRAGRYRGAARCLLHVLGRSTKANSLV
jgi:hypothetical protein